MIVYGLLLDDPASPPTPGWLCIDKGRIAERHEGDRPPDQRDMVGGSTCIICPGFIDAHTHLPQFDAVGCDGLPLLAWLDRVIYPAESWWGRTGGVRLATKALESLLHQGTLGAAGYLTSHGEAAWDAVQLALRGASGASPLRMILGRVAMDREAPDDLTREDRERIGETPTRSPVLPATPDGSRCEVSANPRFAVACSAELLAEIGWVCEKTLNLCVQTHLAESRAEVERVAALFPDDANYTSVYDRFSLLRERSLLAHCVHLSSEEWEIIAKRKSVAVHCPTANMFLRSGLFDLDAAREHGVRLALGSDVAAGSDVAMPRVARAMIETAKARALTIAPNAHIPTPAEVWRLITQGNAQALGWSDAGALDVGASADLLVLRTPETWLDEHLVGRLLYNWSPSLIETRVVAGAIAHVNTM